MRGKSQSIMALSLPVKPTIFNYDDPKGKKKSHQQDAQKQPPKTQRAMPIGVVKEKIDENGGTTTRLVASNSNKDISYLTPRTELYQSNPCLFHRFNYENYENYYYANPYQSKLNMPHMDERKWGGMGTIQRDPEEKQVSPSKHFRKANSLSLLTMKHSQIPTPSNNDMIRFQTKNIELLYLERKLQGGLRNGIFKDLEEPKKQLPHYAIGEEGVFGQKARKEGQYLLQADQKGNYSVGLLGNTSGNGSPIKERNRPYSGRNSLIGIQKPSSIRNSLPIKNSRSNYQPTTKSKMHTLSTALPEFTLLEKLTSFLMRQSPTFAPPQSKAGHTILIEVLKHRYQFLRRMPNAARDRLLRCWLAVGGSHPQLASTSKTDHSCFRRHVSGFGIKADQTNGFSQIARQSQSSLTDLKSYELFLSKMIHQAEEGCEPFLRSQQPIQNSLQKQRFQDEPKIKTKNQPVDSPKELSPGPQLVQGLQKLYISLPSFLTFLQLFMTPQPPTALASAFITQLLFGSIAAASRPILFEQARKTLRLFCSSSSQTAKIRRFESALILIQQFLENVTENVQEELRVSKWDGLRREVMAIITAL